MTQLVFVVAHGSTILGQSETRDDGIGYLKETYGEEKFVPDNYFPKCQGLLEEFNYDDNEKKFRLIEVRDNGIDLKSLLHQASKKKITRIPKPSKPVRNEACTPMRTRLVTGKKTPPIPASRLPEGTVKLGNDGTTWINKKKGGSFKWVKYYEETHEGLERKRKAPKDKAKEFKVGTVMKGEDGKEWMVKKMKGDKFKWVRNN
jgi:hypothetical protein